MDAILSKNQKGFIRFLFFPKQNDSRQILIFNFFPKSYRDKLSFAGQIGRPVAQSQFGL
jgi:hypothetical protein